METTIFQAITKSIETIGLTNTILAACILIVLGYLYYNKDKTNKVLKNTVNNNNSDIVEAISSQNAILFEMQKTNNELMTAISSLESKIDGFLTLTVGLIRRDTRKHEEEG